MSSLPRNIDEPPSVATALSVETRVRVDLLLNMMATFLPAKVPNKDFGIEPDLMACLCEWAFLTSVVNSVDFRSAMERRERGPKGEERVVVELGAVEYALF